MDKKPIILLIEDDPNTCELYKTVLTDSGFVCDTARDGSKGLSMAQKGGYDLILLDLMLPIIDGLKILTELKKSPPIVPNGPIVIATNLSHVPVINEALRLGAADYFVKSNVNPNEMINKIKSVLELRKK